MASLFASAAGGPEEIVRFTAEPSAADAPAVGLWLITSPGGTVVLAALMTLPRMRPAPVSALPAAACVSPTTSGTVTIGGPVEITRFTAVAAGTSTPAPGLWLITSPEG